MCLVNRNQSIMQKSPLKVDKIIREMNKAENQIFASLRAYSNLSDGRSLCNFHSSQPNINELLAKSRQFRIRKF